MQERQLEYLVALDRERHFGRAAQACHVTQPTLSAGIRALELGLGVPLVRRGPRYAGLTPEGERVLRWARRIVADHRDLQDDVARMRGEGVGTLRIGAIPTTLPMIARLTSPLLQRHPDVRVEVRSATAGEIASGLDAFELDAGVSYLDGDAADGLRAWPLYEERYLLVCPTARVPGWDDAVGRGDAAARGGVRWADLDGLRLCLLTRDMQNRRILDQALAGAGAAPDVALETSSLTALLGHLRLGWASVVAHPWLDLLAVPSGFAVLPIEAPAVTSPVGLLARDRDPQTPMVAALTAIAGEVELPAWSASARS